MSYVITHRMGWDDRDPPLSTLHDLLDELADDEDDVEHGSIAVSHEGGAALEVGRSGHVVFTPDLEADDIGVSSRLVGEPGWRTASDQGRPCRP
jgi:hypothetical protein